MIAFKWSTLHEILINDTTGELLISFRRQNRFEMGLSVRSEFSSLISWCQMNCKIWNFQDRFLAVVESGLEFTLVIAVDDSSSKEKITIEPGMP